jgi:branched-chain amino acid transport system permease protein
LLKLDLLVKLAADGAITGSLYGLIAVGFSLLWWLSNIIHVAHGAVYLVSGYVGFIGATQLGFSLPLSLCMGVVCAAVLGVLIEKFVYQPLEARAASEDGVLTVSLALLIITEYLITLAFGPEGVSIDAGLRQPLVENGPRVMDRFAVWAIAITVAAFSSLALFLRYTKTGKSMRAVAENTSLSEVMGMPIVRIKLTAHALAALLVAPPALLMLFDTGIHPSSESRRVPLSGSSMPAGGSS